jgi:uncharacterized protein YkwD
MDSGKITKEEAAAMLERLNEVMPEVPKSPIPAAAPAPTAAPKETIAPTPTYVPTPTKPVDLSKASQLELLLTQLINQERSQRGLTGLENDPALTLIARQHSQDMTDRNFFAHDNPDGEDPTARASRNGFTCRKDYGSHYTEGIAENIYQAWLYSSITYVAFLPVKDMYSLDELAALLVDGWMNSPGHRANILNPDFDRGGVGVAIGTDDEVLATHNFC